MENQMLEYASFGDIKLEPRVFRHIVHYYTKDGKPRRPGDDRSRDTLQTTHAVMHFLLYAKPWFKEGRDQLFIRANQDGIVCYAYIVKNGCKDFGHERVEMTNYSEGKPIAYLASPFFAKQELITVAIMENIIKEAGYQVYSPSRDGITLKPNSPPEERAQVIEENKMAIERCSVVVANTDGQTIRTILTQEEQHHISDHLVGGEAILLKLGKLVSRDPGTYWELGYAHGFSKPTITFSHQGFDINVMIGESIIAHTKTEEELLDVLRMFLPIASPLSLPNIHMAEVLGNIIAKYNRRDYAVT